MAAGNSWTPRPPSAQPAPRLSARGVVEQRLQLTCRLEVHETLIRSRPPGYGVAATLSAGVGGTRRTRVRVVGTADAAPSVVRSLRSRPTKQNRSRSAPLTPRVRRAAPRPPARGKRIANCSAGRVSCSPSPRTRAPQAHDRRSRGATSLSWLTEEHLGRAHNRRRRRSDTVSVPSTRRSARL